MPKDEWGTKRLCPTTGKRFYDMNRTPIVSPYTGEAVELDSTKTRMIAADADYPGYGWSSNKGYGSATHMMALGKLGPSPLHRRSFAPVAQHFFDL